MALNTTVKRLTKELAEIKAAPAAGIRINPSKCNLMIWTVEIDGPEKTPYVGGKFVFTFTFSHAYPGVAPKVKCMTKMFHCNINTVGDVCLNLLKEDWSPVMTVAAVASGLQHLLAQPNPESPLDPETGVMFEFENAKYLRKARFFTKKYAM